MTSLTAFQRTTSFLPFLFFGTRKITFDNVFLPDILSELSGVTEGVTVGAMVGFKVGIAVGTVVGLTVGVAVGCFVGTAVGVTVGVGVGDMVGVGVVSGATSFSSTMLLFQSSYSVSSCSTSKYNIFVPDMSFLVALFHISTSEISFDCPEDNVFNVSVCITLPFSPPSLTTKIHFLPHYHHYWLLLLNHYFSL